MKFEVLITDLILIDVDVTYAIGNSCNTSHSTHDTDTRQQFHLTDDGQLRTDTSGDRAVRGLAWPLALREWNLRLVA
jgi:hypothetical protein